MVGRPSEVFLDTASLLSKKPTGIINHYGVRVPEMFKILFQLIMVALEDTELVG